MPRTRKTGLYYPKKGTAEARAWGREMARMRKAKGRRKRRR